ncbi:ricin B-like lectin [Piromyces finnis]|uniref:Ricin B-like lectin n=1 Tax=Piromyces finnis TaxID=1754191 RepID=A0A1Y1UV97_9FUNG|nr:ricin B-like lectin [Piromyces finnis]|eukprot:ORX41951.1 ricin B-like lectin [Piromyces finnis]
MRISFVTLLSAFCAIASAATPTSGPKGAQLKDGWYFIKNPESGKYLQVSAATNGSSGGNLVISKGTKDQGQKWKVTNVGKGLVTFTTALGDYMIDVSGGKNENGTNVQLYNAYGGDAQQFMILKTTQENVYTIGTKVSYFDKALDIEGMRTEDGTNVLQWTNEMKPNQGWSFERADDDDDDDCWSDVLGYSCCSKCLEAVYEDQDGKWGVEKGDWCGILPHCI